MSQENVEIVRRVYDAIARRDTAAVLNLYHRDIEWDFSRSPIVSVGATPLYHGHEGLRRWWQEWGNNWDDYEDSCEELIDAGDAVISVIHSRGRGRASGVPVDWRHFGVWTVREGKVARVVWVSTHEQALEAAGLSE